MTLSPYAGDYTHEQEKRKEKSFSCTSYPMEDALHEVWVIPRIPDEDALHEVWVRTSYPMKTPCMRSGSYLVVSDEDALHEVWVIPRIR